MWWSTGSGKTGGASSIMNEYLDTDKKIIFTTSVEAMRSN
jgi:DNA replication protein DnaC